LGAFFLCFLCCFPPDTGARRVSIPKRTGRKRSGKITWLTGTSGSKRGRACFAAFDDADDDDDDEVASPSFDCKSGRNFLLAALLVAAAGGLGSFLFASAAAAPFKKIFPLRKRSSATGSPTSTSFWPISSVEPSMISESVLRLYESDCESCFPSSSRSRHLPPSVTR
jgi:hypothetical protein